MLLSTCIHQVNISSSGQIIGLNFQAWIESAKANGLDVEIMSNLFPAIEAGLLTCNNIDRQ